MSTTLLPFAQLPGEVLLDSRLTPTHIRVLIALYMHMNKKKDVVWPKRETLSRLTGLHESKISRATTELESLGWVTKVGTGGRSKSCSYRVHVPELITSRFDVTVDESGDIKVPETLAESNRDNSTETLAESETVSKSETVSDLDLNPSRIGHQTLAESDRGIEHTKNIPEQTIKTTARAQPRRLSVSDLVADGVDEQVAAEFLALRRRKRANLTALALDGLRREAGRAGVTLDAALRKCVERGWQGFEADWISEKSGSRQVLKPENFKGKTYVGTDESAIDWIR